MVAAICTAAQPLLDAAAGGAGPQAALRAARGRGGLAAAAAGGTAGLPAGRHARGAGGAAGGAAGPAGGQRAGGRGAGAAGARWAGLCLPMPRSLWLTTCEAVLDGHYCVEISWCVIPPSSVQTSSPSIPADPESVRQSVPAIVQLLRQRQHPALSQVAVKASKPLNNSGGGGKDGKAYGQVRGSLRCSERCLLPFVALPCCSLDGPEPSTARPGAASCLHRLLCTGNCQGNLYTCQVAR